jgi:hypothetical protein
VDQCYRYAYCLHHQGNTFIVLKKHQSTSRLHAATSQKAIVFNAYTFYYVCLSVSAQELLDEFWWNSIWTLCHWCCSAIFKPTLLGFKVLMVVKTSAVVFWVVMLFNLISGYTYSGRTFTTA